MDKTKPKKKRFFSVQGYDVSVRYYDKEVDIFVNRYGQKIDQEKISKWFWDPFLEYRISNKVNELVDAAVAAESGSIR